MDRDEAMMAVRLAMQAIGGALTTYGVTVQGWIEPLTGLALMAAGYLLSLRSRRALRAQALSGAAALGMAREMVGRR
jgi:hypothetical protein